ncbi:hypothetical protein E2C01_019333 [Portunus trituberculatus]|uniref:Uncharacterized protein n=1 Tax=Portunus trituberculatus TaxID=210409 RepID=A0A5B7DYL0_PORTR|nr:hypothetical protein [Portunus trituberculatus]
MQPQSLQQDATIISTSRAAFLALLAAVWPPDCELCFVSLNCFMKSPPPELFFPTSLYQSMSPFNTPSAQYPSIPGSRDENIHTCGPKVEYNSHMKEGKEGKGSMDELLAFYLAAVSHLSHANTLHAPPHRHHHLRHIAATNE